MTIAQKVTYGAKHENGTVIMFIGNAEVRMPYEDALKLSQFLRVAGKQAKRFHGDVSRHWSSMVTLVDAEAEANAEANLKQV